MISPLTIATRGGALALAQTQIVVASLREKWPDLDCRIEVVTTHGDRDQRTALWDLRAEGFFTSQLEQAVLAGQADVAVHSLKDLPTRQAEGLRIAAVCDRRFPEDCLVAEAKVRSLEGLGRGAKVGTSSLRRAAQVRHVRPDVRVVPLRGNVTTRLNRVEDGQVDAVILARAGLERLGLAGRIGAILDPRQFIPAAGQGALAVQARSDDRRTCELVGSIDDPLARTLAEAERQVLISTGCGCHAPVGAFAEMADGQVRLHASMADPEGSHLVRLQVEGPPDRPLALAQRIAADLLKEIGAQPRPR